MWSLFFSFYRYAVVIGANKGLGLGICKQLAADHGITVILTTRDEQRGVEAVEKLKESAGLSDDQIIFHQLDVADPSSVSSLADFIKNKFGRLDILVLSLITCHYLLKLLFRWLFIANLSVWVH